MDRHTLEKKIMRMERELLALKTACERGLGAMSFYRKTLNFTPTDTNYGFIEVIATLKSTAIAPAFMQLGSTPLGWTVIEKFTMSDSRTSRWAMMNPAILGQTVALTFECISGAEIDSLTARYIDNV